MSLLTLQNIIKDYADRNLLNIKHLEIHTGDRIGIVGTNGSGKSTLLQIISGQIQPDTGTVKRNVTVDYLPQLKPTNTEKSGGEVTADYIVDSLNNSSGVLLADEPTTHLDTSHIEWLTKELTSYQENFIIVSHNRDFLNHTCNKIWEIDNGNIREYTGNYTQYVKEKDLEFLNQQKQFEKYISKRDQLLNAKHKKDQQASNATDSSKVSSSEANAIGTKPYYEKKLKNFINPPKLSIAV